MKVAPVLIFQLFYVSLLSAAGGEQLIDLDTAILTALRNSKELEFARYDQKLAAVQLKAGARQFLPAIQMGYTASDSVSYDSPDSRIRKMTLGVKQLLFDGGRLLRRRKDSVDELELSALNMRASAEQLVLSVIDVYMDILKQRLSREIQEATFHNAREQLSVAEEELRLGIITELDLLDLQATLADLELELEKTAQDERLLMYRFARLLGCGADAVPRPSGGLNDRYEGFLAITAGEASELAERYLAEARKSNPEFIRRGRHVAALRAQGALERWSWLPEVRTSLQVSMAGERFPLSEPGFSVALEFAFPISLAPVSAAAALGRSSPQERSRAWQMSAEPLASLEGIVARGGTKLALARAEAERREFEEQSRISLVERIATVRMQRSQLALLRRKLGIGEARQRVERLRAELGEKKPIELLASQIELDKQRIAIAERIVELYRSELALLRSSGIARLAETHRYIVHEQ